MTLGATLMIGCAASESGTTGTGGSTGSGGSGSGGTGSGGSGSGGTGSGGMIGGSGGTVVDTAPPVDTKPETAPEVKAETAPETGGGVTFTALYTEIFGPMAAAVSSCAGTDCHDPGVKDAVNMKTQMLAYTSLRAKVTPANVGNSALIRRLESTVVTMRMPLNKPALTAAQIMRVRAWIMAGAMNN
jgi:hypothetical protein